MDPETVETVVVAGRVLDAIENLNASGIPKLRLDFKGVIERQRNPIPILSHESQSNQSSSRSQDTSQSIFDDSM